MKELQEYMHKLEEKGYIVHSPANVNGEYMCGINTDSDLKAREFQIELKKYGVSSLKFKQKPDEYSVFYNITSKQLHNLLKPNSHSAEKSEKTINNLTN